MSLFIHDESDSEPMADINVTPLVDVMLVLLITFMIAMPVLTYTIPINLPTTSTEDTNEVAEEPLRLSIDKEGKYFLNNRPISIAAFSNFAKERSGNNPETILAISADGLVDYKHVVEALEIAQKSGIKKIGFVTEKNKH